MNERQLRSLVRETVREVMARDVGTRLDEGTVLGTLVRAIVEMNPDPIEQLLNSSYRLDVLKWLPQAVKLAKIHGRDERVNEADYHGRDVKLNEPTPIRKGQPGHGKKQMQVYVKDGDDVKRVTFGDPDSRIRRSNPKARKNFRSRHNCDSPGPRTKARYWSCKAW